MNLPRIAVLFVACSVVLTAAAKSKEVQEFGSKPAAQQGDVPKSIADSVSGTLQFAEGNFLAVAEVMPENKYAFVPTGGNFRWCAQLRRPSKARCLRAVRLLQRIRGQETAR